MNKEFLDSQIEKTKSMLGHQKEELAKRKITATAMAGIEGLEAEYMEAVAWVDYYKKGITDDEMMLEIYYTARDLTS